MHFSTRQVAAGKTNKIAFPADKKRMAKDSEGYRYFHSLDGKIFPNYLTVEVEIGIWGVGGCFSIVAVFN